MSTEGKKERRKVEEEELLEGQLVFKGPQGDLVEDDEEED
jgi:hypothetical protein